jgi:hypothetical protein
VAETAAAAAQTKEKSLTLSINWPQAVIQLNFSDAPTQLSLEEENPDEGA